MQYRAAAAAKKYNNTYSYIDDNSILEGAMSGSDHARHHMFNRSFDTASNTTSESPDHGPRRNVRFVNERREFDPRYDPRRPETFHLYYQPRRNSSDDERRSSPDQDESHLQGNRNRSTQQDMRPKQHAYNLPKLYSNNRATTINRGPLHAAKQTRQIPGATSYPREESNGISWGKGTLFQPEDFRLDRPFDESSNSYRGSTTEIDSLDEFLEQDSITTATETTGEGRLLNVLSVIEEHPSLEDGSLSHSFTQSRVQGLKSRESDGENKMPSFSQSPLEVGKQYQESDGEKKMPSFSQSPLEVGKQYQDNGFALRNQHTNSIESSPGRRFGTPESARKTKTETNLMSMTQGESQSPNQQNERYPMPKNTRGSSTQTSGVTQSTRSMLTPGVQSTTSAGLPSPSRAAQQEAEKLIQSFNASRRMKDNTAGTKTTSPIPLAPVTSASTTEESHTLHEEEQDLTLHDLCGESSSVDDVAWRNALHVLSIQPHLASVLDAAGWTPLHVACLGSTPPPVFMTRALLYVYREAARKVDGGGRLPLHLVAASSGDAETMDLLIQEYPQAVYQTDYQGWTPLHLLLKNFSVDLHLNHCRILLGLVTARGETDESTTSKILQRRGQHLSLPVEDLDKLIHRRNPVTRFVQENIHESAFEECPQDVQTSLRRLSQWKRKQRRKISQCDDEDDNNLVELDLVPLDAETNPAAHFTPIKRQLPLHIVVRRGLSQSNVHQEHELKDDGDDEGLGIDREVPTTSTGLAPRFIDLVRLFIAFYPEALVARDYNGQTPLLAALSLSNAQPSLELVNLLLGKRTPGYNSLPSWAQSISFFDKNADRYLNPAMVPCIKSHQLPLHVVAEEMADDHSMISAVCSCYPGAIQCQDARGRTPLHILLGNYRRRKVDLRTIALLLSDSVAQTLDDQGKLPFDLLVEKAQYIPFEQPQFKKTCGASESDMLNFKKFFQCTIMASSGPNVRNRFDANRFLWQLHSLPPWLRRYACSATFVQELIIEELASPFKCALILLYAALLCTLIVSFRIRVQNFIDGPDSKTYTSTELTLYTSATALLVFQLIFWSLCTSMSEFLHFCVFNFWRWVELSSIVLACVVATLMNNKSLPEEVILATATAATGMLYLSVVGFLANWWYGASVFLAYVEKMALLMFWPVAILAVMMTGFSQMVNTVAHLDCSAALGAPSLCSLRESYILLYFLMVGEPIVAMDSDATATDSVMALVVLCSGTLLLLVLGIIAMVVFAGSKFDFEEVGVASFWEPKLVYVLFANGLSSSKTAAPSTLETAWIVATNILSGHDGTKGSYWYACFTRKSVFVKSCYWIIAFTLVPIWMSLGLITFGLLWPPQVRRFLFRPRAGESFISPRRNGTSSTESYAAQISSLRTELAQVRDMSYERSVELQRDLRELKEILLFATTE